MVRFTGQEREDVIGAGLDDFGVRYFSVAQGRFTAPDEFTGGPVAVVGSIVPHPACTHVHRDPLVEAQVPSSRDGGRLVRPFPKAYASQANARGIPRP